MLQDEEIGGADAEHHDRVPVQAISKLTPSGQRQIFAHGQRVDVADAAAIEIARAGMVKSVGAPPEVIGVSVSTPMTRPTQSFAAMTKKRPVAAIVLDHEEANEEAGGRHGEQQAKPIAGVESDPHQDPEEGERHRRDRQARACCARSSARGSG